MTRRLDLEPLLSRVPVDRPFTPATAAAAGLPRSAVDQLVRTGRARRVLRGVYAATELEDSPLVRRDAVALVTAPGQVVVGRTAGWVHGVPRAALGLVDREVPREVARGVRGCAVAGWALADRDVVTWGPLRLTSPVRTALDLARELAPGPALACLDGLVATRHVTHLELLAELPRTAGAPGADRLRSLVAQVDGRSTSIAESVLRLRWGTARLPTATPAHDVVAGGRAVRLALADPERRFGASLSRDVAAADLAVVRAAGWWVVVLPEDRVLHGDPDLLVAHLEREYHQHLLALVG